jgi:ribonuclease BN (tRNA processing enzyme)
MRLTILGSGTMMPTKNRYPAAYLVEEGNTKLLLDCGHLTIARLIERGIDLHNITAVGITHFHTDHFSNLLPLVHARWVDDMVQQKEQRPLTIFGPATLEERYKKLREVMWPEPTESYAVTFVEGVVSRKVGNLALLAFPVQHVQWFPSVGFKIVAGGKSLVYTGDLNSEQGSQFEDDIRDVDLLLIEADAVRPSKTHFTAEQAVQLAQRCGIKRVVLTHVREDRIEQIRAIVAQHANLLTLAEDGMTIDL